MKIATSAYPIDWLDDWQAYDDKITRWVEEAAGNGADLLVFPEYGAMELASLGGKAAAADLEGGLRAVADRVSAADELHDALAKRHGVHILAASAPVWDGGLRPVNRARFFGPSGPLGHQDKQIMTRFERDPWNVVAGGPLTLFDTALGKIGMLICYDCEFPLLARALIDAGAEILLAPSCTEAMAGYSRVRIGAMARALENQCITVHSPTVGSAPWCPAVETNTGAAAIYGPPDTGFPPTGVIAQGELNQPGWVYGDVSLDAIREVRADGGVLNHMHWAEQLPRVKTVTRA
ncbi:MAG: carbon-nitrogen hydrolase family protein [Paracoccaceae bacterium]